MLSHQVVGRDAQALEHQSAFTLPSVGESGLSLAVLRQRGRVGQGRQLALDLLVEEVRC